jgi:hypothetical protein
MKTKSSKHRPNQIALKSQKKKRKRVGLQILFAIPSPPKGKIIFVDPFQRAIKREHFMGNVFRLTIEEFKGYVALWNRPQ